MEAFAARLLDWFARHGRKDLPWQQDPSPYRVWVSEIMLQQTQVNTVIPYFQRFMARFPDLAALAAAPLDEVLHHWSGLGYYARARHLHRAAGLAAGQGGLPATLDQLTALPGIGRSTAGAILALAHGLACPILDGNVKRVLCRFHALPGWPGAAGGTEKQLWVLAESHTPARQAAEYTQAIMDLGATVCTRSRPACGRCPQQADCRAHLAGRVEAYPAPRPRKPLPVKQTAFLILCREGQVLLQKRPARGVWGGLWSFPECPPQADIPAWCRQHLGLAVRDWRQWPWFRHTFTHFHLDIAPLYIALETPAGGALENRVAEDTLWYDTRKPPRCGLAAPVAKLLSQLPANPHD